jgi:hypothetical protein
MNRPKRMTLREFSELHLRKAAGRSEESRTTQSTPVAARENSVAAHVVLGMSKSQEVSAVPRHGICSL